MLFAIAVTLATLAPRTCTYIDLSYCYAHETQSSHHSRYSGSIWSPSLTHTDTHHTCAHTDTHTNAHILSLTNKQGNSRRSTFKHFPKLVKCCAQFVLFSCSWKFQWNVCKEGSEMQFRVLYSPHLLSCLFMHWEISGGVWDAKQGNNITRTQAIVDNY